MGTILSVLFSMIVANFLYQAINDQVWSIAIERSYFQAIAIGCIAYIQWLNKPKPHDN